jgi:glycosyltransferase involved in cell wall biosynthesis
MKVLFLTQTTEKGPATRYRASQYFEYLRKNGIQCTLSSGLPDFCYGFFYDSSSMIKKLLCLPIIILRRAVDLFRVRNFDLIFIQREILPQCWPLFELLIFKLNRKVIFDFDDAIFLIPPQRKNIVYKLRCKSAVEKIVQNCRQVIAGNNFLADYARRFNPNVEVIPTVVDTQKWKSQKTAKEKSVKTVIGWIGSENTVFYLYRIRDVLKKISKEFDISLHLIGGKGFECGDIDVLHFEWDEKTEVELVSGFDIGIAPLNNDQWEKGKCGLKLIQYMACSVASVCSAVGVHKEIIQDGKNGFLAETEKQWYEKLKLLIENKKLRSELAARARMTVDQEYSLEANKTKMRDLIIKTAERIGV